MAKEWKIVIFSDYRQFLLAILPPGAFIFTGLLIAVKNSIDNKIKTRQLKNSQAIPAGTKRVRVTGSIA